MIRSWPSLAFGSICVAGTVIVLFGHIRHVDDLTLNHLYIVLALTVTLGAGHFMWDSKNPLVVASFATLFVVGTIVCVGLSGGRSAEILAQRERNAHDLKAKRDAQRALVRTARDNADAAQEDAHNAAEAAERARVDAASECATGKGSKCDGKTVSYAQAQQAATDAYDRSQQLEDVYRRELQVLNAMPLPPVPNADLLQFARVWSYITHQHEDAAMDQIKLFLPYAFALLTEFGAIMFFKHGFSHRPAPTPERIVSLAELSSDLNLDPKLVRKTLRALNVPKPVAGWQWPAAEAARIAQRITTHRGSETVH